jgi:N-acetyl-anhydromuramyl-L-alanine amidase AmpD
MSVEKISPFPHVYPWVTALVAPDKLVREPFPDRRPNGIVVHYTADRDEARMRRALEQSGLCYHLIISRNGNVTQHAWLDRQVWHAGKAIWNGHSPNHRFLAVGLVSWGELQADLDNPGEWKAWNGSKIDQTDVAFRPSNHDPDSRFHWDTATSEQMAALNRICVWASSQGIPVDNICGHDECALPKGRKPDPGGVLPMNMIAYRSFLKVDMNKVS